MVGIISINEDIVFTDEELPPEGTDHTRALYITIRQGPDSVPLVLIDNGSDLNVCPLRVALRLGLDPRDFIKGMQGVRAFDNIRRDVIGEVDLVITVGCVPFTMTFQVLDIQSSSNLLLRRPWLHAVQAVPSSLHQRLKLKHDGRILVIPSEEEIVDESDDAPALEVPHSPTDVQYHSFQFDPISQEGTSQLNHEPQPEKPSSKGKEPIIVEEDPPEVTSDDPIFEKEKELRQLLSKSLSFSRDPTPQEAKRSCSA